MSGIELSGLSPQTAVALLGLPVLLALAGLVWTGSRTSQVERRLQAYSAEPEGPVVAGPAAFEKAARPPWARLLVGMGRLVIGRSREKLNRRLAMAGRPGDITAEAFIGLRVLVALLSAAVAMVVSLAVAGGAVSVILGTAITLLGFRLPNIWLLRRISARQAEIRASLPDALDLITVSAEAGLAFEAALARLSTRMTGALAEEFELMLREIGLGKTRRQALRDLADRNDVAELRTFVAVIVQTDELGVTSVGCSGRRRWPRARGGGRRRKKSAAGAGQNGVSTGAVYPSGHVRGYLGAGRASDPADDHGWLRW